MLDDRYRHHTLFKTSGVDILWFATAHELFYALASAVVGHQNAYEKRDILHGDVSDGNTLMLVKHISEESAVPSPPDNPPVADCRDEEDKERLAMTQIMQGTLPFELNQSLKGEPVEYHHDLQSYFWFAYLITCNCASPFNTR
ncbi:hypothetical protein DFH29DRAFT_814420 [Suillus ampliporus]|nr:hypothetical protein DFH29DRAFT_814420 [Suillus ampliporus]